MANAEQSSPFSGRAQAYAQARPGYPEAAIEYICSLIPKDAVIADIGAGTGKFAEPVARCGYEIFAVEPDADMREQLAAVLAQYPNAKIVDGAAEATMLPDHSVDVISSAQALNWFDIDAFRLECKRIGKPNPFIITLFNYEPAYVDDKSHGIKRYDITTSKLYSNPVKREFQNPILFDRNIWLLYHLSMAGVPFPGDPGYETYTAGLIEQFNRSSVGGILRHELVTRVYSERMQI